MVRRDFVLTSTLVVASGAAVIAAGLYAWDWPTMCDQAQSHHQLLPRATILVGGIRYPFAALIPIIVVAGTWWIHLRLQTRHYSGAIVVGLIALSLATSYAVFSAVSIPMHAISKARSTNQDSNQVVRDLYF